MIRFAPAGNDLFDSFFDDMFPSFNSGSGIMRTDIREKDGNYLLDIDLPGYKKEDIKVNIFTRNKVNSCNDIFTIKNFCFTKNITFFDWCIY